MTALSPTSPTPVVATPSSPGSTSSPQAGSAPAKRDGTNPSLPSVARTTRLVSIDAYRGLVMLLMMGPVLSFHSVARNTGSAFWSFLAYQQNHVEYLGCSLHDLIQSSFSFLVGVALPFSLASRRARGQSIGAMTLHAIWRSLLLILLGVFLSSHNYARTNFDFTDTLCQIGFGYVWLFLLAFRPPREQWIALIVILVGYWLAFALYPVPNPPLDYAKLGIPSDWLPAHPLTGFAAHWNKYGNASWAFDCWFLNLFPQQKPWVGGEFGSTTLSFIPTLGTMILGLLAGGVLRSPRTPGVKICWLLAAAVATGVIGWTLGAAGVCPVVKRIWTPTWTLFSGGWCFLFLAFFYAATDVIHRRAWVFPLVVVGMNSIAAYWIAHMGVGYIRESLQIHFGRLTFHGEKIFRIFGAAYQPLTLGACVLLVEWFILWWMYRRKVFLKI